MICKHCKIEMGIGKVFEHAETDERARGLGSPTIYHGHPLKMIDCWKCSKCGHSEWLVEPQQ
jgi:hypothetical protein